MNTEDAATGKVVWGVLGVVVGAVSGVLSFALTAALCCGADGGGAIVLLFALMGAAVGPIVAVYAATASGPFLTRKLQAASPGYRTGFTLTLLAGFVGANIAMGQVLVNFRTPPTDAALLAHFAPYESELKSPVAAADARGSTLPGEEAFFTRVFGKRDEAVQPGQARFVYWRDRLTFSAHTHKGYAFLQTPPRQVLPTLDDPGKIRDHDGRETAYRHIRGHWYLFYEHQIW